MHNGLPLCPTVIVIEPHDHFDTNKMFYFRAQGHIAILKALIQRKHRLTVPTNWLHSTLSRLQADMIK